jgi:hypothetical protein
MDSDQVTGVLPTPAYVRLTNATGSGQAYATVQMGNNVFGTPNSFTPVLECEDRLSGGSVVSDATCSDGKRLDVTVTNNTLLWTLSAGVLQAAAGNWFRLLLRMVGSTASLLITPSIRDATGATTLWQGEQTSVAAGNDQIVDLGAAPLPPGGYNLSSGALTLALVLSGSSVTTQLDYIYLLATDGSRHLDMAGLSVANGCVLLDNPIDDFYAVDNGGNYFPLVYPRGEGLLLYPGRVNRVAILHQTWVAGYLTSPIANTTTVQMYFRPRRLVV